MAQRISRAKRRIAGQPLDRAGELGTVPRVLYLLFNEGYGGEVDLAAEAIRITRQLAALADEPECPACSRSCCCTTRGAPRAPGRAAGSCRWASRTAPPGTPRLSPRASASCRPRSPATGSGSTRRRPRSPLHADAPAAQETDWVQIVEWYDELVRLADSPVVRLNRAVAIGEADGPRAGLAAIAELDPGLPRYAAVAAHLHERAGDLTRAADLYAEAARRAASAAERDHCVRQAARVRQLGAASRPSRDPSGSHRAPDRPCRHMTNGNRDEPKRT